jgi:hypothetical protein
MPRILDLGLLHHTTPHHTTPHHSTRDDLFFLLTVTLPLIYIYPSRPLYKHVVLCFTCHTVLYVLCSTYYEQLLYVLCSTYHGSLSLLSTSCCMRNTIYQFSILSITVIFHYYYFQLLISITIILFVLFCIISYGQPRIIRRVRAALYRMLCAALLCTTLLCCALSPVC